MFLEHFAGCMLGWFAWISCQKLDSLLLFVIFITLILLTWLGIISETYFSKKQAHLCGKVNDQCWVEMKRLLGKKVMKGHIPWTYRSSQNLKISVVLEWGFHWVRVNLILSTAKTVCTLAFYLLIFRLPFVGPQDRVGILKTEGQNSSFNFSSAISP